MNIGPFCLEGDWVQAFPLGLKLFYYTCKPFVIIDHDLNKLSEMEKEIIDLLEQFAIMGWKIFQR